MAEAFSVTVKTIYAWKHRYPEFKAACEITDEEKLVIVKKSLFHRAAGFEHPAVKIMTVGIGGGVTEIVEVPYTEYYPPDTAAIKYYLNNRDPTRWRERAEVEGQTGELVVRIIGGLPEGDEPEPRLLAPPTIDDKDKEP